MYSKRQHQIIPATSSNAIPLGTGKRVAEQREDAHPHKRGALADPENNSKPVYHHRSPRSTSRSQDLRPREGRPYEKERLRRKRAASPSPEKASSRDLTHGSKHDVQHGHERSANVRSPEKKRAHKVDITNLLIRFSEIEENNFNAESFEPLLKILDRTERCYGNLINILLIVPSRCFRHPKKFIFLLDRYVHTDLKSVSAQDATYIGNIFHKIGKFCEEMLNSAHIPNYMTLIAGMFNILTTLTLKNQVEASNIGPALWGLGKFYQWKMKCVPKTDHHHDGLDSEKVAIIFHKHSQLVLHKEGNLQNIVNALVGLRNLAEIPPHGLLTHINSQCVADNFHRIANHPDASAYPISQTLSAMVRFNHFQPGLLDDISVKDAETIFAKLLEDKDKKANSLNMAIALYAISTIAKIKPAFLKADGDELLILKLLDKIMTDKTLKGDALGYVFSAIRFFAECRPKLLANMGPEKIAAIFKNLFSHSQIVLPSDKIRVLRAFDKLLETLPKLLTQISLEQIIDLFKNILSDRRSASRDLSDALSILGTLAENRSTQSLDKIHSRDIVFAFTKIVRLNSNSREIVYALNALGKFSQFKPRLLDEMKGVYLHDAFRKLKEKAIDNPEEQSNVLWVLGSLAWLKDVELIDEALYSLIQLLTPLELNSLDIVNALLGLEKISEVSLDFLNKVPPELIGKAFLKVLNDTDCTQRMRTNILWTIGKFAETYKSFVNLISSADIFLLFSSIINDPVLSIDQNARALAAIGSLAKNIPTLTEKIHAREIAKSFAYLVHRLESTPEKSIHTVFLMLGRLAQYQPRLLKYLNSDDINKILTYFFNELRPCLNHASKAFWALGQLAKLNTEILVQVDPVVIENALTRYLRFEKIDTLQITQIMQPLGWIVENAPALLDKLSPQVLFDALVTLMLQDPNTSSLSNCIWVFGKFAPKQDKFTNSPQLTLHIYQAFSQLVLNKVAQANAQDLVQALYALGKFAEFRVEILKNIESFKIKLTIENLMRLENIDGQGLSILMWALGQFAQHFSPALGDISAELIKTCFSRLLETPDAKMSDIGLAASAMKKLSLIYPTFASDSEMNQAKRKWVLHRIKLRSNKKQEHAEPIESSHSSAGKLENYHQHIQALHQNPEFIEYFANYEKSSGTLSYTQRKIALAKLAEQLDTEPGENTVLTDPLLQALYCLIDKDKCAAFSKQTLFFNILYMLFEEDRRSILTKNPDPERHLLSLPTPSVIAEDQLHTIMKGEKTDLAALIDDEFVNAEYQLSSRLLQEERPQLPQDTPDRLFYRVAIFDVIHEGRRIQRCSGADLSVQFIMVEEGRMYFQGHLQPYPQLAGFAILLGDLDPITGQYLPAEVKTIDCRHGIVGANVTCHGVEQPHPIHALLYPLGTYAWHPMYGAYVRREVVMENDHLRMSSAAFSCCLLGYNLASEILMTYHITPPSDRDLIDYILDFHLDNFNAELVVSTRLPNIIFNCMDPRLAYYLTCEFFASYIPETMYSKFVVSYDNLTETINSMSPSKTLDQSISHLRTYFGPESPFIAPTYDLNNRHQLTACIENAKATLSRNSTNTMWIFPVHFVFENEMHALIIQKRSADQLSVRWWDPKAKPLSPSIAEAISQVFRLAQYEIKRISQVVDLDTDTSFSETALFLSLIMICRAATTFPKEMDYLLEHLPPEVSKERNQALLNSQTSAQEITREQYRSCVRELDPVGVNECYKNFIESFDPGAYFESLRNSYVALPPLVGPPSRNVESSSRAPARPQSAPAKNKRSYTNNSVHTGRAQSHFFKSRDDASTDKASSSGSYRTTTSGRRK